MSLLKKKCFFVKPAGLLAVVFLFSQNALALDFKIDLPPSEGRETTNHSVLLEESVTDYGVDYSPSPSRKNKFFIPEMKCLTKNVAFWEKVYRDIDVDEALFHDRDDLSRIYTTVKVPKEPQSRKLAIAKHKEYIETSIRELLERISEPEKWERRHVAIANQFSQLELKPSRLVQALSNIRVQTGLKTQFDAGVKRSLTYLPAIQEIIEKHKLPLDIVYLPHVESSYHPFARSKVGAVGLWQLMPYSMRSLMGPRMVNQRTDVRTSTVAAARHLIMNYQQTRDWPLAITAYNHGLNGVMRAIRQTESKDLCTIVKKYESKSFRFASSNFFAQFLAARNVAAGKYAKLSDKKAFDGKLQKTMAALLKEKL